MNILEGIPVLLIPFLLMAGVFFGVAWLLLPFAIFGIKPRLDKLIRTMEASKPMAPASPRPGEDIVIPESTQDISSPSRRS